MARKISSERKAAYYLGAGIMVVGGVLFLSAMVTTISHFGDIGGIDRVRSDSTRALAGMVLIMVGIGVRTIGARGLAGSGVVLDPEQAREDFEPYTRMAGGMVKDALDEADVSLGSRSEKVIMVKCRSCARLNDEDARFCQGCGQNI